MGLENLKDRRNILSARFANKCLMNEKTKGMFKRTIKKHQMNLRIKEKFKLDKYTTSRMRNSAIPSMVKILNNKHNEIIKKLDDLRKK